MKIIQAELSYNNPNFLYLNDKSDLDWILNTLEEEKYIRIVRAKQSRNIINAFSFTSKGFICAEKLINKARNGIGNETIYRRSEVVSNLFLFVTANDNEKEAFEDFFVVEKTEFIKAKSYKIGKFGLYSVAHIHINEQGTTNPESIPLVGELIREIKPVGVIMVGIAFGANECTQKIGDVLVSKKILNYDSEKIRENDNLYKEDPKEVGFQLFNAFCNDDDWIYPINDFENSRVHKGAMLTGSKLINNEGFKQKLLNDFQNFSPIGGEMEAYGIYSICRVHGVNEWIIVKAICDWAYNKDTDKEKNQKVASKAAVNFCNHVFSCKGIFDDLLKSESEMNAISEEVKKKHNKAIMFYNNDEFQMAIEILTEIETEYIGRSNVDDKAFYYNLGFCYITQAINQKSINQVMHYLQKSINYFEKAQNLIGDVIEDIDIDIYRYFIRAYIEYAENKDAKICYGKVIDLTNEIVYKISNNNNYIFQRYDFLLDLALAYENLYDISPLIESKQYINLATKSWKICTIITTVCQMKQLSAYYITLEEPILKLLSYTQEIIILIKL